jgi:hypothetical protein
MTRSFSRNRHAAEHQRSVGRTLVDDQDEDSNERTCAECGMVTTDHIEQSICVDDNPQANVVHVCKTCALTCAVSEGCERPTLSEYTCSRCASVMCARHGVRTSLGVRYCTKCIIIAAPTLGRTLLRDRLSAT